MDLRTLKYFAAVYEHRSVSGAARDCYVSQPSISTAIGQLEATLETRLFIRHARGVLPTPNADKLYPIAKEMANNTKAILKMFSEGSTPVPLRLGIMRSLGAQRMSFLLQQLTTRIDNLELTLVDPEEPCDARVVLAQSATANEQFIPIWQDQYYLAIPKHWPLAAKDSIELHQLDAMPFISRSPCDSLEQLKALMANCKVKFQTRAHIRTVEYAWQLVNAGIGAALLPNWHEIEQAPELVLKPITGVRLSKEIGLASRASHHKNDLINLVKKICLDTDFSH